MVRSLGQGRRSRYIKCSHVQWHQTIGHERKMEQNVLRGAKAVSIRSMRYPPKVNISKSACIANRNDRGRRDLALAKTLHATRAPSMRHEERNNMEGNNNRWSVTPRAMGSVLTPPSLMRILGSSNRRRIAPRRRDLRVCHLQPARRPPGRRLKDFE